jgi:hypothetical protein
MAEIKAKAVKGSILCLFDNAEMEFIMPENFNTMYIHFTCPVCGVIYMIPSGEVGKRIRMSATLI